MSASLIGSSLRRVATQARAPAFRMGATPVMQMRNASGKSIKDKTFKDIWLGDRGAWPVIGVIGFACVFCTYWGMWTLTCNPEVRINREKRKSTLYQDLQKDS
ncbi:unnamed protein product [Discosporangium mesarthrocarpum]